jgi:CRISPR-associated protein Cas2
MGMTVVVTRDVQGRYRGFLGSCMLELAPGVYTSPRMTKGIRERVWTVLDEWFSELQQGSLVMTWTESGLPGGQGVAILGTPAKEIHDFDGILLARRALSAIPEGPSTGSLKNEIVGRPLRALVSYLQSEVPPRERG